MATITPTWSTTSTTQARLAHEEARRNRKDGNMSVPLVEPGNAEAATVAEQTTLRSEDMGPGHIMGNLVADPELRFTPSGRPVARVRIAYTPRVKSADGKSWDDQPTEFYDVIIWGDQGERVAEHLKQGDRVLAVGTFTRRFWKDRENKKRETIELVARDFGPSLLFHAARVDRSRRSNGNPGKGEE